MKCDAPDREEGRGAVKREGVASRLVSGLLLLLQLLRRLFPVHSAGCQRQRNRLPPRKPDRCIVDRMLGHDV